MKFLYKNSWIKRFFTIFLTNSFREKLNYVKQIIEVGRLKGSISFSIVKGRQTFVNQIAQMWGKIFFAYHYGFDLCNLHSYTTENDFILIAQNMKENFNEFGKFWKIVSQYDEHKTKLSRKISSMFLVDCEFFDLF